MTTKVSETLLADFKVLWAISNQLFYIQHTPILGFIWNIHWFRIQRPRNFRSYKGDLEYLNNGFEWWKWNYHLVHMAGRDGCLSFYVYLVGLVLCCVLDLISFFSLISSSVESLFWRLCSTSCDCFPFYNMILIFSFTISKLLFWYWYFKKASDLDKTFVSFSSSL